MCVHSYFDSFLLNILKEMWNDKNIGIYII